MTNLRRIKTELSLELARDIVYIGEEFRISLDDAWVWLGYPSEADAKRALVKHFDVEIDFIVKVDYQHKETTKLSIECFKALAIVAGNDIAKTSRRYFIEAEKIDNRPERSIQLLLKELYDVAIDKCFRYYDAENAMDYVFLHINRLDIESRLTVQLGLLMARQALENLEDKTLNSNACYDIIWEQFTAVYMERDGASDTPHTIVSDRFASEQDRRNHGLCVSAVELEFHY